MADEKEQAQLEQPIGADGGDVVGRDRRTEISDVDGPVAVNGGEAVDARHSQGLVYKPSGPVTQHFGDEVHGDKTVTHIHQGENLRDKELAYLDGLLKRYEYWLDHYTPLAGIAEVRAAVKDGPRLDLPMPFVPREFETLAEHGFGERVETKREQFDDLREAIAKHRRIILLGDPGSGKTTTLWRLAYDYALEAREDERAPLPVFVALGGYSDDGPFEVYLARHLGMLTPHLEAYRASGRLVLLLDGLNEMPRAGYEQRVGRIREALDRYAGGITVVTCRVLDYVIELKALQRVGVSPLDVNRIRDFLHNYLGEVAGERLLWELCGGDEVHDLWDTAQSDGMPWKMFCSTLERPRQANLTREPPQMLSLCSNPYMLLMMAQVYAGTRGVLPANRARLFEVFVDTLLARERERCKGVWIEAATQKDGLASLAYAMQVEGEQGTTVGCEWAIEHLCEAVPGCDAERLLYLAASASLLDASDATVRFCHQLLQDYFTVQKLGQRVAAGESLDRHWSMGWGLSGWEETFILLAGMEADASTLLVKVAEDDPVFAVRCLTEGGAQANESARKSITNALVMMLDEETAPAISRVPAGEYLACLGDPRPGVGLRDDGLPDIVWCKVPAGSFVMGTREQDIPRLMERYVGRQVPYINVHQDPAYIRRTWGRDEIPQHTVHLPAFQISKHLVTNAQYAAFVQDGGYTQKRRDCWTDAGWKWKGDLAQLRPYVGFRRSDLPNAPVTPVGWYEAVAFCRWLTARLHEKGELSADIKVMLPSEAEWEKAARGTDGRIYPWGNEADANRANYNETGIRATSVVGCFPGGASPYGALDMAGNVWEWTRSLHKGYPYNPEDRRENLDEYGLRTIRGGSWNYGLIWCRCASRGFYYPFDAVQPKGFRLVVAFISP